ncbi:MAG: hypothetical protein ACK53Y_07980, partial [bacterium]
FKHKKLTNLTPLQSNALIALMSNKNITIKPTDKNLGPAVLDTKQYIGQTLQEHLLTPSYRQLSHQEAINIMETTKTTLKKLIQSNSQLLSKPELTFLNVAYVHFTAFQSSMASRKFTRNLSPSGQ